VLEADEILHSVLLRELGPEPCRHFAGRRLHEILGGQGGREGE
jgi:hypothetical protein